ncbi:DUF1641 domain-containing protein [Pistricoccus aurantiacus]|uniref:DUF1641 domain-containing protein n=1 Tax=Pistricoccus aurantiacus TaxID=1883414 RepID=A0A5B8STC2_9GAMM|nr:DUF1641 domain-containing protein [Pistricoccus aurantiacus]QEA39561.1 DUF1641 domain-containing protein [Pistricoccus aurantiacus]
MAKAIRHEVTPLGETDATREELDRLLDNLQDAGILRLLNDFLEASPQVTKLLLDGLNREESRNAMQNLMLLLMGLGRVPPERFAQFTDALGDGTKAFRQGQQQEERKAPGIIGAYKLLHDDALWQRLYPLLDAMRGMADAFDQPAKKPAAKRHESEEKTS